MAVHDDTTPRWLAPVAEPPDDPYYPHTDQRQPSYDLGAERAVLGAALRDPNLVPSLAEQLAPEDFYNPIHETIYTALLQAASGTEAEGVQALLTHLQASGQIKPGQLDGPYLHTLYADPTPTHQAGWHASWVAALARRRRGQTALRQALQRLEQPVADPDDPAMYDALAGAMDALDDVARTAPIPRPATTGLADLSWLATGQPPVVEPPIWGRRTDGHALFYAARVNGIYGDPEAAKSWISKMIAVEALNQDQLVVIIDVDHNGAELTASQLLLLGARPDQLANPNLFRYYQPEDGDELKAAVTDAAALAPAVAVLDSIGEMLPMLGVKSVDNDEITAAMRTIAFPLARAGACTITIDHLPKSAEARATGFAIGGTAKKRAIDGAYIHAEARHQPAPGQTGRITLRVEKDRPGELRKTCTGKYVGTFTLDSTNEHAIVTTIGRDHSPITETGVFRPTHLMETVSRFIEDMPRTNRSTIEKCVRGKRDHLRAAVDRLLEEGYIDADVGPRGALQHTSIKPFREADDDQE